MKFDKKIYNRFLILKGLGFHLTSISKILKINYHYIIKYNFYYNTRNCKDEKVQIGSKQEPYYYNEMQYATIPTYNYNDLSEDEKKFYYDNLIKGN